MLSSTIHGWPDTKIHFSAITLQRSYIY
jgi:hypothetical protein